MTVNSPTVDPLRRGRRIQPLRFDYAGPIGQVQGHPVFTDALSTESALHFYDATKRPEQIFPSFVGKSVRELILDGTLLPIDRVAADRPYSRTVRTSPP
ncbi:hypothetical protein [Streptomyces peucetius]|uniref:Uncharacterized protein n=1 Tax=Streptomyces peucetius TaxID=1950 RepID=A0ABY6IIH5_STRPE|nr:hypothetical protein [Streptomyces peucetius]UYQ66803.1 hypothetical protein OGH68_02375 [Streptomyces peucetius]